METKSKEKMLQKTARKEKKDKFLLIEQKLE